MEREKTLLNPENSLQVIKEIELNPQITQRDLAKRLNISLGKINFLINALVDKGIIEAKNFKNSKNKMGYRYIMTAEGIKAKVRLIQEFFAWKLQEYEKLKEEIEFYSEEAKKLQAF